MAKYYEDGNYVVIEYGDTLWAIATDYKDKNPDFKGKTTLAICKQIGSINGLADINRISVGTKLKLTKDGSSPTSSSNKLTITQFGLLADPKDNPDGKTLFATWTWDRDKTESYKVLWTYDIGNGLYIGQTSTINVDEDAPETSKYSTYDIPDDAKYVKFKVKPIAKKKTENDKDVYEWEQDWSKEEKFNVTGTIPPDKPTAAPTIDIVDYQLIISLTGLDDEITSVDFRIYKDYGKNPMVTKTGVEVINGRASYPHTVSAGSAYTVQYRVARDDLASDWSDITDAVTTKPDAPTEITAIRASSEESVYLAWTKVNAANAIPNHKVTYDIQYATKLEHFENNSDQINEKTGVETTHCDISGLEPGKEYYFRVRATNDKGSSSWTDSKSVIIGSTPEPPTTWSSVSTAITGEDVALYWVHNSEDGSYQRFAKLELFIDNEPIVDENGDSYTFSNEDFENSVLKYTALTEEELEDGKTHSCLLKTGQYTEGTKIEWHVKTAGITGVCSDWSTQRTIDIYAPPTLELKILKRDGRVDDNGNYILVELSPSLEYIKTSTTVEAVEGFELPNIFTTTGEQVYAYVNPTANDIYYCVVGGIYYVVEPSVAEGEMGTVSEFPFYLNGVTGPNTQSPIGYHVAVTSNSIYETTDNIGNPKTVNAGEEIYSNYFDTFQALQVEFNPGNIDLENNIEYTITCTASMNSGLSVTESVKIKVVWSDAMYEPNAAIGIDRDTLTASIRPYCANYKLVYYQVEKTGSTYKRTDENLGFVSGAAITGSKVTTITGERVYQGITADGVDVYYCTVTEVTPVTDIFLSVYRREFDGSFTELATNLDGERNTTITDPHPSLDFARYRVVATSKSTGAVSYYDLPGHAVGETAIIIQWNEAWTSFETTEEGALEQPPWSGSLLRLPYNIDVSENVDPEVEMIEYIGRSNPVSYYGTQRRQTATWNVVIEKSDKETIYALRRLANWLGDVYVREPSGVGYWAHVVVSFNQTHLEKTIPVTLTITRVEGGM